MPFTNTNYNHLSDLELFTLVKHENTEAFEVLYRRYWPELLDAAFKRLQSHQKSEDMVQEIFISIYSKRATLEFTVSLQAYLHQALKYKVLNEYRSGNIRKKYAQSVFFSTVCKNDLANGLEAKELLFKINLLLQQLPQKCRMVFTLSRSENMTNKEIALALNISVSTVEKQISKALKKFRESLFIKSSLIANECY